MISKRVERLSGALKMKGLVNERGRTVNFEENGPQIRFCSAD